MSIRANLIIVLILIVLIILKLTFFVVDEKTQAVITQLGEPIKVITSPGLYIKVPILQQVTYFEKRLLDYDAAPAEILAKDKKTLVVDNFCKWRIVDPLKFLQTVKSVEGAQARIDDIVYSELRVSLGLNTLHEIISDKRSEIMEEVTKNSNKKASEYGIEIVDVRIKRADLPPENEKHVFDRMRAEREKKAKQYRSEGKEEALKIRAEADKERTIILAEAYKKAQIIKGEGDAIAAKIYAESYKLDPEFFEFLRTLEAYKKIFKKDTIIILSPEKSEFLKYFYLSD